MRQYFPNRIAILRCHIALLFAVIGAAAWCPAEQPAVDSLSGNAHEAADVDKYEQADALRNRDKWIALVHKGSPLGFHNPGSNIVLCGDVALEAETGELRSVPGGGVLAALKKLNFGDDNNLVSNQPFGDCEVYLEFLLGKDANSGVKLQQRYEVQLFDSHGKESPSALDCGGIYPHWVFRSNGSGVSYLDEGVPPKCNAAKPAGEWQQLRVIFRAPRFNRAGKKIKNACFELVTLNDTIVQQNVDVEWPTGNTSNPLAEVPYAPLYLQLDHGAVAFRNVRVKPLDRYHEKQ